MISERIADDIPSQIKKALAIRRVFSLVGMIINTKFSNCTLVFKIGGVRQQNIQSFVLFV